MMRVFGGLANFYQAQIEEQDKPIMIRVA